MAEWKLADAKNRLSEVVTRVDEEGPQRITRRNNVYVLITEKEYKELKGEKASFIEFLLNGPDLSDLDLERSKSLMRDVEF